MSGTEYLKASDIKISVVTATMNAAAQLSACMRSVQAQRHPNVEHVIVDGGSTDRTVEVARTLMRPTDRLVSEADNGIYDAMNRGVGLSTGDYILFMGSDDYLFGNDVLSDAAKQLAVDGLPDMLYGDIEVRDPSGGRSIFHPPGPDEALDLMICGCLPHQATFAHRRMFTEKVGLFDLRYRVQSDYDWFLRALSVPGATIRSFSCVIASFALGGASSRLSEGQAETYQIQNSFPIYRQPEWVERRLHVFQRETLELRKRLQALESPHVQSGMAWVKLYVRRLARRMAAAMSHQ